MGYLLDKSESIWKVVFDGTLVPDVLHELAVEVETYERTERSVPNRLLDLRKVDKLDVTSSELIQFATLHRTTRMPSGFKSAYLASNSLQFGFARMVQSLLTNPQNEVRVFRDEEEALEWLTR